MSVFLASYDPGTGKVLSRHKLSDREQVSNYPNSVEISESVYMEQEPENRAKIVFVDVTPPDLVGHIPPQIKPTFTWKTEVTMTPADETFTADGVDEATITLAGLTASANVRIGANSIVVTVADPTIQITSDTPRAFNIYMDDPNHWANPVTVRAV